MAAETKSIEELEKILGYKTFDQKKFDEDIFTNIYPKCVNSQIKRNNTVLFNGMNVSQFNETEIAILFVKNFSGEDIWKEEREKLNEGTKEEINDRRSSLRQSMHKNAEIGDEEGRRRPCICKDKKDFKLFDQIQCDNCEVWYHQFCMKISKSHIELLHRFGDSLKWFCNECLNK